MSDETLHHWGVDVRINAANVLTIESNCVYGKSDLSELDKSVIRTAAKHLLAFVGDGNVADEQTATNKKGGE